MPLPKIWMTGRLTADPNLRFLESGIGLCTFTIVDNDRRKNDATGQWEDHGDPLFVRVSAWRQLAEHAAESLTKGDLVVVSGKLQNRKWQDQDGNTRDSLEIQADTVAVSLQFRVVKHQQAERGKPQASSGGDDPWGTPPPSDEPPF